MATCNKCGQPITIGDYPFCPHGPTGAAIARDEIPGGMWIENLGTPEPVFVRSHSERRAIMRANGLREMVRHAPLPGTDKSPHTTSWATIDPYTLDAAATLVARAGLASPPPPPGYVDPSGPVFSITVRNAGVFTPTAFGYPRETED